MFSDSDRSWNGLWRRVHWLLFRSAQSFYPQGYNCYSFAFPCYCLCLIDAVLEVLRSDLRSLHTPRCWLLLIKTIRIPSYQTEICQVWGCIGRKAVLTVGGKLWFNSAPRCLVTIIIETFCIEMLYTIVSDKMAASTWLPANSHVFFRSLLPVVEAW